VYDLYWVHIKSRCWLLTDILTVAWVVVVSYQTTSQHWYLITQTEGLWYDIISTLGILSLKLRVCDITSSQHWVSHHSNWGSVIRHHLNTGYLITQTEGLWYDIISTLGILSLKVTVCDMTSSQHWVSYHSNWGSVIWHHLNTGYLITQTESVFVVVSFPGLLQDFISQPLQDKIWEEAWEQGYIWRLRLYSIIIPSLWDA